MWSGLSVYGGYVYHARFLVQSNDRSPGYLEERVEAFIANFREVSRVFFLLYDVHVLCFMFVCNFMFVFFVSFACWVLFVYPGM